MKKRQREKAIKKLYYGGAKLTQADRLYLSREFGFKTFMDMPEFKAGLVVSRKPTTLKAFPNRTFEEWARLQGDVFTDADGNIIPCEWISPAPGNIDPLKMLADNVVGTGKIIPSEPVAPGTLESIKDELKKLSDFEACERQSNVINLLVGLNAYPLAAAVAGETPRTVDEIINQLMIAAESIKPPVSMAEWEGSLYAIFKDSETAKKFSALYVDPNPLNPGNDTENEQK